MKNRESGELLDTEKERYLDVSQAKAWLRFKKKIQKAVFKFKSSVHSFLPFCIKFMQLQCRLKIQRDYTTIPIYSYGIHRSTITHGHFKSRFHPRKQTLTTFTEIGTAIPTDA